MGLCLTTARYAFCLEAMDAAIGKAKIIKKAMIYNGSTPWFLVKTNEIEDAEKLLEMGAIINVKSK